MAKSTRGFFGRGKAARDPRLPPVNSRRTNGPSSPQRSRHIWM